MQTERNRTCSNCWGAAWFRIFLCKDTKSFGNLSCYAGIFFILYKILSLCKSDKHLLMSDVRGLNQRSTAVRESQVWRLLKIYNTPCTFRAPKARGGYRSALPLLQSVATKRMQGYKITSILEMATSLRSVSRVSQSVTWPTSRYCFATYTKTQWKLV